VIIHKEAVAVGISFTTNEFYGSFFEIEHAF
jgi:hypothetical protein